MEETHIAPGPGEEAEGEGHERLQEDRKGERAGVRSRRQHSGE